MDSLSYVLDGVDTKAKELIVVLTTNNVRDIQKLMLRPGWIDAVISIQPPDESHIVRTLWVLSRIIDCLTRPRDWISSDKNQYNGDITSKLEAVLHPRGPTKKSLTRLITHINTFRRKLESGQLCLGAGISLNDPVVVEAICSVVDFVWIDMEHNPMSIETVIGHLIAARAGGASALVRVPDSSSSFLKRILDSGAEGVIVPQVRSAEEVQQVVQACRYKPLGNRGWGPRRPSEYGQRPPKQVVAEANEQLFVAVQIENMDAVASLDQIVAVPGIDSIAIGPFDLSASMGLLGRLDHPEVLDVIKTIVDKSHQAGRVVGFGDEANADSALRWVNMGADWIQCGGDLSYMLQAVKALFERIRQQHTTEV